MFAAAVLKAHAATHRRVVLVDSFQGLPPSSNAMDSDIWSTMDFLMVPENQVQAKFCELHLNGSNIAFEKGFFNESCARLRNKMLETKESIAVLRMDGDMYESTMDILFNLYDLVPVGGFVIVDDYYSVKAAKLAIHEFMNIHRVSFDFVDIDKDAVFWKKTEVLQLKAVWYQEFNQNRRPQTQR
jgi:hypothetical protein